MLLDFLERLALIEKKSEFVRSERFKRKQVTKPISHIFTLTFLARSSPQATSPATVSSFFRYPIRIAEGPQPMHRRTCNQRLSFHPVHQHHALFAVYLPPPYLDNLGVAGLHHASRKLCLDGHFAMPAIDQHTERHALRPTQIKEPIHRRPNRAPRIQNVVDQHKVHVVHAERNVGTLQHCVRRNLRQIIAVQRNVQRAHRHIHAIYAAHRPRNPLRQRHTAPPNTDKRQMLGAAALFHYFVRQSLQRAVDFGRRHKLCFFNDAHGHVILAQGGTAIWAVLPSEEAAPTSRRRKRIARRSRKVTVINCCATNVGEYASQRP